MEAVKPLRVPYTAVLVKNAAKLKLSFIKSFVWEELCTLTEHLAPRIAFQKEQSLCH